MISLKSRAASGAGGLSSMEMLACSRCPAFVPSAARACPSCGTAVAPPSRLRVATGMLTLAGSSLFAMTLSACYGVAEPPPDRDAGPRDDAAAMGLTGCSDPASDLDGDGFCGAADCDEASPNVHVGAFDQFGDGIDADCGGTDAID
jgi:hypothetical protein